MAAISPLTAAPDLAHQAYQAILDAICDGRFTAGQRLTQEQLAESLSVSRQPVLQALLLLKREGFIIDADGRGVMVAPLTAEYILHLYQVRSVLDGLAAREAALRGVQLAPELLQAGRASVVQKNLAVIINADLSFHRAIYLAAANPVLTQSAEHHWNHIRRVMGSVLQESDLRNVVWDEHEAIFQAIGSGNAELAQQLAQQHCEMAGRHLSLRLLQHNAVDCSHPPSATSKRSQ